MHLIARLRAGASLGEIAETLSAMGSPDPGPDGPPDCIAATDKRDATEAQSTTAGRGAAQPTPPRHKAGWGDGMGDRTDIGAHSDEVGRRFRAKPAACTD
jgi:hypothetical protein